MAKFTRRGYKRRKVFLGLCLFASVALISTGFASWIISAGSKDTTDGDVTVGVVQDSSVEILINETTDSLGNVLDRKFMFEPKKDDLSGRVQYDGTNFEILSITVSGTVKNAHFITSSSIKMEVPESVKDAATQGYIVLPACVTDTGVALSLTDTDDDTVKTFTYEIAFTWGEKFNFTNPGEYYDIDSVGKTISDADVKTELENFRKAMLGTKYGTTDETLDFVVTVEAKTN